MLEEDDQHAGEPVALSEWQRGGRGETREEPVRDGALRRTPARLERQPERCERERAREDARGVDGDVRIAADHVGDHEPADEGSLWAPEDECEERDSEREPRHALVEQVHVLDRRDDEEERMQEALPAVARQAPEAERLEESARLEDLPRVQQVRRLIVRQVVDRVEQPDREREAEHAERERGEGGPERSGRPAPELPGVSDRALTSRAQQQPQESERGQGRQYRPLRDAEEAEPASQCEHRREAPHELEPEIGALPHPERSRDPAAPAQEGREQRETPRGGSQQGESGHASRYPGVTYAP
jgi:hypothetical protein